MRTSRRLVVLAAAIGAAMFVAMAVSAASVTLDSPKQNARIRQNDASLGCPYDPNRGYGFEVDYSWSASPAADVAYYQVWVHAPTGADILKYQGADTSVADLQCNSFVTDDNLKGWTWEVKAFDAADTQVGVSETRSYRFESCRIKGNVRCSAPPG
jgi:hypothetical protein